MRLTFFLCGLVILTGGEAVRGADSAGLDDELALRAAGLPSDGPGLLAFFKNRTATQLQSAGEETLKRRLS